MEEQQTIETTAQEAYQLDDAAIELLAEISQQQAALNASLQGALNLFARQHKLQGQWRLSANGKELTRAT